MLETFEEKSGFSLISDDGRVPMSCVQVTYCTYVVKRFVRGHTINSPFGNFVKLKIQFATNRCKEFIDCCLHNDIDIEGDIKIWGILY